MKMLELKVHGREEESLVVELMDNSRVHIVIDQPYIETDDNDYVKQQNCKASIYIEQADIKLLIEAVQIALSRIEPEKP